MPAMITTVYKAKTQNLPKHILLAFADFIKKLVHIHLTKFLTHFELLSPTKFSTEQASFYFLNNSMEQIRNNCAISFDLSKEFDTINRDLLLIK